MRNLIYLMVLTNFIFADFDWVDNGVPVRQGYHIEWFRGGDIDSDGNMIIVWSDTRTSSRDVYAQKVDASGNMFWTENGKIIASGDGRQEDPIFISDNAWITSSSKPGGIVSCSISVVKPYSYFFSNVLFIICFYLYIVYFFLY